MSVMEVDTAASRGHIMGYSWSSGERGDIGTVYEASGRQAATDRHTTTDPISGDR